MRHFPSFNALECHANTQNIHRISIIISIVSTLRHSYSHAHIHYPSSRPIYILYGIACASSISNRLVQKMFACVCFCMWNNGTSNLFFLSCCCVFKLFFNAHAMKWLVTIIIIINRMTAFNGQSFRIFIDSASWRIMPCVCDHFPLKNTFIFAMCVLCGWLLTFHSNDISANCERTNEFVYAVDFIFKWMPFNFSCFFLLAVSR